jgi:hypothetical protein
MPHVGFKPTIPVFEQSKTVHASDCMDVVTVQSVLETQNTNLMQF